MTDMQALAERVQKLETQGRWIKRAGCLAVVVTMVVLVVGQAKPQEHTTDIAAEVRAKKFVLVDDKGNCRGSWSFVPHDSVALSILSEDQNGHIGFFVQPYGNPGLFLTGKNGQARIVIRLLPDDSPVLSLVDSDGNQRIELILEPDGSPRLRLKNKDGKAVFTAP